MSTSLRHIFSILLANESGVLTRVSGLFSARGYNIESLTVAPTVDKSLSRMTIVTTGEDKVAEQIGKQLHKLIDVIEVSDFSGEKHVEREMLLAKIANDNNEERTQTIYELAQDCGAEVIECLDKFCVVQMMAAGSQIDNFINKAKAQHHRILEVARSGAITLSRSAHILGGNQ
ncbi:MAG: acetolactate synthase small subunit [Chromatiales bacterium]|nr:acetolactate synthase small subunit [Chromatiales bacterium]